MFILVHKFICMSKQFHLKCLFSNFTLNVSNEELCQEKHLTLDTGYFFGKYSRLFINYIPPYMQQANPTKRNFKKMQRYFTEYTIYINITNQFKFHRVRLMFCLYFVMFQYLSQRFHSENLMRSMLYCMTQKTVAVHISAASILQL